MKNKTIDKILVKLDEISSILKQAKLENDKGIDHDELDGLARTIEMFSAKHEEDKVTEAIPQELDKVSGEDLVKERDDDLEYIEEWCIGMLQKIEKEHKGDFTSGYQRMSLIKAFANGYKKHIDCVFKRGLKKLKDKKQSDRPEEMKERRLKTIEDYNRLLEEINNNPKLDELGKKLRTHILDVTVTENKIQVDREYKRETGTHLDDFKAGSELEKYIEHKLKTSGGDILEPVKDSLLVFNIETLYNAIIRIKELYNKYLIGRVFNYREVEAIIKIFKVMVQNEWNTATSIRDSDKYINHKDTQDAMFVSGWYNYLKFTGISRTEGIIANEEIKSKGAFYPLLASVLALDEWTKENGDVHTLTVSFDYSSLSHNDFIALAARAWRIYNNIITNPL